MGILNNQPGTTAFKEQEPLSSICLIYPPGGVIIVGPHAGME
jgi:hypothetical protein